MISKNNKEMNNPVEVYNGKTKDFCDYLSKTYGHEIGCCLSEIYQNLAMEIAEYNQNPAAYVTMLQELYDMNKIMSNPETVSGIEVLKKYLSKFWEFDNL